MNDGMKLVFFDKYCRKCHYAKTAHDEDPCNSCLHEPVNQYSHKPVKFTEKSVTRRSAETVKE